MQLLHLFVLGIASPPHHNHFSPMAPGLPKLVSTALQEFWQAQNQHKSASSRSRVEYAGAHQGFRSEVGGDMGRTHWMLKDAGCGSGG